MKTDILAINPRADAEEVAEFVANVGKLVRSTRKNKPMSRRVLSETSGVSQRYLAQLETGSGNISIALLYQIAAALDVDARDLMSENMDPGGRFVQFAKLFRNASDEQQQAALRQLQPRVPVSKKADRICLIGLRGAGKSTLGNLLAERRNMVFLELNQLVEEQSGMPVGELMALYGQEGFRHLERRALETVLETRSGVVLAVGGGIVSDPEAFGILLENFHTIWLKALPEEHMERVRKQGDDRPMAGNPKAMDELRSLLTDREDLYGQADGLVDTSNKSPQDSLQDLIEKTTQIMGD